jgi:hypothetical protein
MHTHAVGAPSFVAFREGWEKFSVEPETNLDSTSALAHNAFDFERTTSSSPAF